MKKLLFKKNFENLFKKLKKRFIVIFEPEKPFKKKFKNFSKINLLQLLKRASKKNSNKKYLFKEIFWVKSIAVLV